VHASPNPQVYALKQRSRGLKMLKHISVLKQNYKIGGTIGPGKFFDTTFYALNLQEYKMPKIRNNIARNIEISHELRQAAKIFYYLEAEYNVHFPL